MSTEAQQGSPVALHNALKAIWANPGGLGRLMVVNHTIIGKRFLVTGLFFFLVGGVLAMLIRAQLATADSAWLGAEAYAQVFTMHGTVMMFLFAIPVIEGFSLYLLPKMLGSRDLAFPRLGAFGYFCYLFGGSILLVALCIGVAPNSGWFMYTPLSSQPFNPGINSDVWLIGVTFVEISAITIGVELAVTILKIRAGGMSLQRMPLFAWYMLVTALMILLGFPPLILGSILLELERAFGWPFFDVARGGDNLLWQHLFWLFGHPEVYIIFVPAAGLISTMIPTFAQRPIVGYTAVVVSAIAIGFISFGLWVHHMYLVGIPYLALAFFSAASMLVGVPTAVQFFAWIATLWAGRPKLGLPMLYMAGFLFIFVFGGLTGIMVALVPFNWQIHDTHFVVAHLHYVLVGGFVFPVLAAIYYWMPHMSGRMPSAALGHWAFWLLFLGFNLTFFIMHFTGLIGMPRRIYTYHPEFGWDLFNLISSIGGFVMSAGFALLILDVALHGRYGRTAPRDPWGAGTLEWAMPTPPPIYNFGSLPAVASRDPLWDEPDIGAQIAAGDHHLGIPRNNWQETLGVDLVTGRPDHIVILPRPTWVPFLSAAAMGVFFLSFLLKIYWLAAIGALGALALFLRWAWMTGLRDDPAPLPAGRGLRLLPHAAVDGAPGWWGLAFTLVADGTLLASLLFGYFFLWSMAPNWPPPAYLEPSLLLSAILLVALTGGYMGMRQAVSANAKGDAGRRLIWLAVTAVSGIAAAAAFLTIAFTAPEPPTAHAYYATVATLAGYGAFHCGVGAIVAAHVVLRCRSGFVSAMRSLDLRILLMWWKYTAVTGLLIAMALYAFPLLVAP